MGRTDTGHINDRRLHSSRLITQSTAPLQLAAGIRAGHLTGCPTFHSRPWGEVAGDSQAVCGLRCMASQFGEWYSRRVTVECQHFTSESGEVL